MQDVNLHSRKISARVAYFLNKAISPTFPLKEKENFSKRKKEFENSEGLFEDLHFQANISISLIKDPLWKRVCTEMVNMMGPLSVLKIGKCKLGSFPSQESIVDVECPTEEAVQFVQQHAFIIRGCLQQYFPYLKEIRGVLPSPADRTLF